MSTQDRIKTAIESISQGLAAIETSDDWIKYLAFNSKFYNYSYNNIILIMMQRPNASYVAGYTKWRELVGTLSNRFSQDEDLVETITAGKNIDELRQPQKAKMDKPVTQKQLQYLERLMAEHNTSVDAINKYVQTNYSVEDYKKITGTQASALIEKFKSIE